MNQPVLYRQANGMQRHSAKKMIEEFAHVLQYGSNGKDSLMDIGCGSGDVLIDFIRPVLPDTYTKIIGTDISPEMIDHSRETYTEYNRIRFNVLDIVTEMLPAAYQNTFDHVTSFFCLHWVQNQRQALKNIYNMLINDGDCLLTFIASTAMYQAFQMLSVDPKWTDHMRDIEIFIPASQGMGDPLSVYSKLFKEVGFSDRKVEIREEIFAFEGHKSFADHVLSICGFLDRMPLHKREEFIDDICERWKDMNLCEELENEGDCRYFEQYKLVVAYARK